jgi:hypothetical protein
MFANWSALPFSTCIRGPNSACDRLIKFFEPALDLRVYLRIRRHRRIELTRSMGTNRIAEVFKRP